MLSRLGAGDGGGGGGGYGEAHFTAFLLSCRQKISRETGRAGG